MTEEEKRYIENRSRWAHVNNKDKVPALPKLSLGGATPAKESVASGSGPGAPEETPMSMNNPTPFAGVGG